MSSFADLAVLGGVPRFSTPLACGQYYRPNWSEYQVLFRDIFERQYYTNHGPLAQRLEAALAERLGVRHAILVTNEYLGLVLACQALGLAGPVLVSGLSPLATVQPLGWSGGHPVFCDVDPNSGLINVCQIESMLAAEQARAVLAINPWGDAVDVERLETVCLRYGVPLLFDSSQGLFSEVGGRPLGGFGQAEVFSLHATQILGAEEGGVVCTQSDELAAVMRNMRSSYGMGCPIPGLRTINGRMSEAQAALGLHALDHHEVRLEANGLALGHYGDLLAGIDGLRVRGYSGVSRGNGQNLLLEVDAECFGLEATDLRHVLRAEGVLAERGAWHGPSIWACEAMSEPWARLPGAASCARSLLEIPAGDLVDATARLAIGQILRQAKDQAPALKPVLATRGCA